MSTLPRDLRRTLERAVRKACAAAEAGAGKALESLAVGRREPWESMTPDDRALRNRLRAHGRQLGDRRDPRSREQETGRLVQECAYEHWHRMLFARFLAEAGLLIEPETGVAVTLDEAKELARERGGDWLALAGAWAGRMLPRIFRADDPILDVALPPETRAELEALLEGRRGARPRWSSRSRRVQERAGGRGSGRNRTAGSDAGTRTAMSTIAPGGT